MFRVPRFARAIALLVATALAFLLVSPALACDAPMAMPAGHAAPMGGDQDSGPCAMNCSFACAVVAQPEHVRVGQITFAALVFANPDTIGVGLPVVPDDRPPRQLSIRT